MLQWAISGDTRYAQRAFAEWYGLNFPLLSDTDRSVAQSYDVRYKVWEGHWSVPKQGMFLIDSQR